MADQPSDDQNPSTPRNQFHPLPIEARRRLWEQIWNRLLAPPIGLEDRAPSEDVAADLSEEAATDVAA